ncbi:MAG: TetR/AcrR family transcriptional regulator [Betaproteobacteria bacterium]|nr:TetR/AcrR family transcriptional regulator [Betaproteobacteria bacterium]
MPKPVPASEESAEERSASVAARRTEQIANAAVALFSERGYVPTTIEDISNQIGVGKGLIYRYFKDKQDVLFRALCAVLEKYKKVNVTALVEELGPLDALRRMLAIDCALAEEHAREVTLAYRSTKDLDQEQRLQIMAIETEIVGQLRQCLEACIQEGLMRPLDVRIMGYQFLMFGQTWALKKWALGKEYTLSDYVAEGENLLIAPFLTEAGRRKMTAAGTGPATKGHRAKAR